MNPPKFQFYKCAPRSLKLTPNFKKMLYIIQFGNSVIMNKKKICNIFYTKR